MRTLWEILCRLNMITTTYNGSDIFPGACGLYAYDGDSDYDFEYLDVLEEAKRVFVADWLPQINKALEIAGLKCVDFKPFIPREFNFMDSSLDPVLTVESADKLLKYLLANKEALQKELDSNKSYDGFMALGESSMDAEIETCRKDKAEFAPDIMIVKYLLKDIAEEVKNDFDMNECIENVGTLIEKCIHCGDELEPNSNGEMCTDCFVRNRPTN